MLIKIYIGTRIRASVFNNHIFFLNLSLAIMLCAQYILTIPIVHVWFVSTLCLVLNIIMSELFVPLVPFLKVIDAYLSTPSAFSIFSPASIVS